MRRILLALALSVALPGCAALAPPPAVPSIGAPGPSPADRARAAALYRDGLAQARGNPDRAAELIEQAASLGNPDAQFFLAASHLRQDNGAAAAPWLARAAQQGHVEAMFRLARVLEVGDGVRQERAFAAVWFQRAAERGHLPSMQAMALLQTLGRATHRDEAEALARLTIAAERGHRPAVPYRDALRRRVAPAAGSAALSRVRGETARGAVAAVDRPLARFAQSALRRLGDATVTVDGRDGPATRAALLAFARREGLASTDPFGAEVLDRLRRRFPGE
jgi:hypothetical protein